MATHNKSRNTAGGGLYIALAICILSVICIGVYSAIINVFDSPLNLPEEGENVPVKEESTQKEPSKGTPPTTSRLPEVSVITPDPEPEPEEDVNASPTPPGYTMPLVGEVIKGFSNDILVYSETMNDYRVHNGVDITASVGTPVKAFTDGVVLEIYEDPLMGQTVVLDHGSGTKSYYQNLSSQLPEDIQVGAKVEEGQVVGGVGETCLIECEQASHLHFEVRVNDACTDPMAYFK
jgi:murein DD-endopeptidase MepM/ murein hydrolase activator NlpD